MLIKYSIAIHRYFHTIFTQTLVHWIVLLLGKSRHMSFPLPKSEQAYGYPLLFDCEVDSRPSLMAVDIGSQKRPQK